MSPSGYRTPLTLACASPIPRAGSTYLVQCSPSAVSTALGFSRPGSPPRASARGDTDLAIGSPLKCLISRSPPPLASRGTATHGVSCPTTQHNTEDSVSPGFPHPAPSALKVSYLLDGLHPSASCDGPSTATAFLGFALQGLASPGQLYPSRGPSLSCRSPASPQASDRDFRGCFMTGKGPESTHVRRRDGPNLAFLGLRPSRAFSSTTFEPASRS